MSTTSSHKKKYNLGSLDSQKSISRIERVDDPQMPNSQESRIKQRQFQRKTKLVGWILWALSVCTIFPTALVLSKSSCQLLSN